MGYVPGDYERRELTWEELAGIERRARHRASQYADMMEERALKAEAENTRLREALDRFIKAYETGRNEPLVVAYEAALKETETGD